MSKGIRPLHERLQLAGQAGKAAGLHFIDAACQDAQLRIDELEADKSELIKELERSSIEIAAERRRTERYKTEADNLEKVRDADNRRALEIASRYIFQVQQLEEKVLRLQAANNALGTENADLLKLVTKP